MKKVVAVLGIVVAALIVIVIALPFFVDANRFKPALESDLSGSLGRQVAIGNIHLAIFSGGVTVDNVSIADDPAFSRSPFLTARQLTAGVSLIPLIFSKKLEVRSFTITDPQVSLLRSPSGTWNFSSLGAHGTKSPAANAVNGASRPDRSTADPAASPANFSVEKLTISNGTVVVGTVGTRGKKQTYRDVNLEASNVSYTSQFPFRVTLKTPGSGTVSLNGTAGPINSGDVSLTPFRTKINASHIDLASTGFVPPSAGLAGVVDFNGEISSNGRDANSQGTLKTEKIKLVAGGAPSSVPVGVNYATDYNLKAQTGTLTRGDIHIGKALAHLTGTYDATGPATTVQMKLKGQAMPVTDLQGVLPAAGVTLPSGASLKAGNLNLNLTLTGPVDKLMIAGPVNLANGKLANFSLKSKLGALASFAGLGGGGGSDTDIQLFSTKLRVEPQGGIRADDLKLMAPAVGEITGSGTVSPAKQLDFRLVAKLATGGSPLGSVTSAISSFASGGKSGGGIPFRIKGTTSNPVFIPDVAGIAKGMLKSGTGKSGSPANTVQGILGGLFGSKKKQ